LSRSLTEGRVSRREATKPRQACAAFFHQFIMGILRVMAFEKSNMCYSATKRRLCPSSFYFWACILISAKHSKAQHGTEQGGRVDNYEREEQVGLDQMYVLRL
jgi:hypothetical protein